MGYIARKSKPEADLSSRCRQFCVGIIDWKLLYWEIGLGNPGASRRVPTGFRLADGAALSEESTWK